MNRTFLGWMFVIFCISLGIRVVDLDAINQVVFDEVHFGKFISSYCCTHQRFFDIHPPVGKLVIAGGAYMFGYNGQFSFDHIGQMYTNVPITALRIVPAVVGALLPIIGMVLLRQAGVSYAVTILGGFAVALENALIVEARFILTDSILLAALFGCIAFAIAALQTKHTAYSWYFACIAGILAGVAVGTKFTGALAIALGVCMFLVRARMGRMFVFVFSALLVYLISWMLHFSLLTLPGSGDVWGVTTGAYWQDLFHTHQQMLSANYNLTATHPYGSAWWSWPFMTRSVFYWQGNGAFIYFLGNPVVWWGSIVLFICGLVYFLPKNKRVPWVFLVGYAASFVPLMRVPRVLFLYHYLTPFLFSLLFGMWILDQLPYQWKPRIIFCSLMLIIAGFLFISPLTYGFSVPQGWQNALFFISSWR